MPAKKARPDSQPLLNIKGLKVQGRRLASLKSPRTAFLNHRLQIRQNLREI
jgi:hypothetical protein